MTLNQIYDRMDQLLKMIYNNQEDQDCFFKCEIELTALEQLRECIEQSEPGEI